ncbi:MAG: glycosyltransferase family 2 protein [Chloroflexi bacterium]|nr:glycosyltransferase family 2 protein [Chloroflexota bacterium]
MRVGQNPVKSVESIAPPAPVTVVVISYIPFLAGYYAQSLEILKRCLGSIAANTDGDYDLMLFDNGSCAEVRAYLLEEQAAGRIQYLTLSERNFGKAGAWNIALAAAPGNVVVYADSDVFFHPGWLPAHLAALKAFPQAGMVSGLPILTPEKFSSATIDWANAQKNVKLERGPLITWQEFWRHARTLGDDEPTARAFYDFNPTIQISKGKARYFIGAAHFQFAAPKAALEAILPIPAERPMGRVRLLDELINSKGYLRLSTPECYVEHMGNTLPDGSLSPAKPRRVRRLRGPLRKLLQWIYDRIFTLLYRND